MYLTNKQDEINEQGGKNLIINSRAGWNKREKGANFEALINEQA